MFVYLNNQRLLNIQNKIEILKKSYFSRSQLNNRIPILNDLYDHFRYAQKAKEKLKKHSIDLNQLTDEQKHQFRSILRFRKIISITNILVSSIALFGFSIWYFRSKKEKKIIEQIEEEFKPIWLNLKYFQHKAALIHRYVLPEQIVRRLNEIKHFEFNRNDIICASFPKSGTTLLQEIVFLIETNFNYELAKKQDLSQRFLFLEWPTTNLTKISLEKHFNNNEKRFFKTHLPPIFFNSSFEKTKVIYIYRNPKDVTVSFFHFLRSINVELTYNGPWDQFVHSFLIDEVYYAPWSSHLNDYFSLQTSICFISYEDLLTNFRETVKKIAIYLGKENELTEEKLNELEKWCSFQSMKINPQVNYNWLKQYGFFNQSFDFLRKGEIGDWLNHFNVQQSIEFDQMVEKRISPLFPSFNYGITKENQNYLYQYDEKKNQS